MTQEELNEIKDKLLKADLDIHTITELFMDVWEFSPKVKYYFLTNDYSTLAECCILIDTASRLWWS